MALEPGVGTFEQYVGMGKDLAVHVEDARAVWDRAVDVLQGDAAALPTISIVDKFAEDFEKYIVPDAVMV